MSLRKLALSLTLVVVVALAMTSTTFAASPAPHQASTSLAAQQVRPLNSAQGGGCWASATNVYENAWVSDEACISGYTQWWDQYYQVDPDTYITYHAPYGYLWSNCTQYESIVENGKYIWSTSFDCTGDALAGGTHYYTLPFQDGFGCGNSYYIWITVGITYNGHRLIAGQRSPTEYIGC